MAGAGEGGGGQVIHSCTCVSAHVCVGVPISDDSGGGSQFISLRGRWSGRLKVAVRASSVDARAAGAFWVMEGWKVLGHDGGSDLRPVSARPVSSTQKHVVHCCCRRPDVFILPGAATAASILSNVTGNTGKIPYFGFFLPASGPV